ncbi:LacI family DNA-binding transcriptional regulator [Microbacterium hydrocarbonoxydans]|uniref:LacI family DNA-binding transcriptional regulator n=1 Tax=Microbacterium hydrocarbonoxydans TaxID=273678 RepID=UPI003D986B3E
MISDDSSVGRPATVHDVARRAGVSAQTVSRLVKGFDGIRPATRERVLAAIEELGYRPNLAARLLRTRRSTRIGALIHNMFERGPGQLLRGAASEARSSGYSLNIRGVDGLDESSIDEAFDLFEEEQVAGIVVVTLTEELRAAVRRRSAEIPIMVDPAEAAGSLPTTGETGGRVAAEHLLSLGHRRLGFLGGPPHWVPSEQRRRGFVTALVNEGATVMAEWHGDWTPAAGASAALEFDPRSGITAIFVANDAMAIGLMHGLMRRGIGVPEQVSVVGFDDIPEAPYLTPELTSVRPDFEGEGRNAIVALVAAVERRPPIAVVQPISELIVRRSTGPVSSRTLR